MKRFGARCMLRLPLMLGVLFIVASCGGGGGGGQEPTQPVACQPIVDSAGTSIPCTDELWAGGGDSGDAAGADGTAGDGAPIVGARIQLTDSTGRTASATTDANGYYRLNVTRMKAPFTLLLTKADGTPSHHGYSLQQPRPRAFITINVSGLTDKLCSDMARAAGKSGAGDLTPSILAANPAAAGTALDGMRSDLRVQIEAAGLASSSFDPVGVFFRPDRKGIDMVLETVAVYVDANGATQFVPKPMSACTLPSSWAVAGRKCYPTSHPGYLAEGATTVLSDTTAPNFGTAGYRCVDGVVAPSGDATCTELEPPKGCDPPSASWSRGANACTADTAPRPLESGASQTLQDSADPTRGAITYTCTNGALAETGETTCDFVPADCSAPAPTWTVNGLACASDVPPSSLKSGTATTLVDTQDPTVGAISYSCTDGRLAVTPEPSCSTKLATCAPPARNWTASGIECESDVAPGFLNEGATITLSDTNQPTTGTATYACRSGKLQAVGSPSCALLVTGCAAPSESWSVGSNYCVSDTAPVALGEGQSASLLDSLGETVGAITYRCSSGSLGVDGTPSCGRNTQLDCSAPSASWVVDKSTCSADNAPGALLNGQSVVVTDSQGPTTGSISYSCNSGRVVAGTSTCATVAAAPCDPGPLAKSGWGDRFATCYPDSVPPSVPSGTTFDLFDGVAPGIGMARYTCSNGVLTLETSSCSL